MLISYKVIKQKVYLVAIDEEPFARLKRNHPIKVEAIFSGDRGVVARRPFEIYEGRR